MAHTTYLWWFGGWFVIVLPTLWNYAVLGFTMLPLSQPLSAASLVQPFFIQLRCRPFAAAPTPNPAVLANELRWCAISREKRHQLPLYKGLLWTSFKEILFLINPVQKRKSLGKSASSLQLPWLLSTTSRTLWFSGCDRIAFW